MSTVKKRNGAYSKKLRLSRHGSKKELSEFFADSSWRFFTYNCAARFSLFTYLFLIGAFFSLGKEARFVLTKEALELLFMCAELFLTE